MGLLPTIVSVETLDNYVLEIVFDDGKKVHYDMKIMMDAVPEFQKLRENNLFENFKVDESGGCIIWTDMIDMPSDGLYEYGVEVQ